MSSCPHPSRISHALGTVPGKITLENTAVLSNKSDIHLFYDPALLLLGVYRPRNPYTVLSAAEEKRKQQCFSMGEHLHMSHGIYTG